MAIGSISFRRLGAACPADTSTVTVYTVGAGKTAYIKSLALCNVTAADVTVNVHLVPSGGSAGVSNAIFYGFTVPAHQSVFMSELNQVLEAGGFIAMAVGTASGITMTVSGQEIG